MTNLFDPEMIEPRPLPGDVSFAASTSEWARSVTVSDYGPYLETTTIKPDEHLAELVSHKHGIKFETPKPVEVQSSYPGLTVDIPKAIQRNQPRPIWRFTDRTTTPPGGGSFNNTLAPDRLAIHSMFKDSRERQPLSVATSFDRAFWSDMGQFAISSGSSNGVMAYRPDGRSTAQVLRVAIERTSTFNALRALMSGQVRNIMKKSGLAVDPSSVLKWEPLDDLAAIPYTPDYRGLAARLQQLRSEQD